MKARKYLLPEFLNGITKQADYERWSHRKALAHVKRDRKRENKTATNKEYKLAIHEAVVRSGGFDSYTGEKLAWDLIGKYDNDDSKAGRREYKKQFALLPSVDHIGNGLGPANFAICAWRTNDSKNDLSLEDFVALCRRVVAANPTL
jgi:hypothetical protein